MQLPGASNFPMRLMVTLTKWFLFMLCHEIYQNLNDLHNSENYEFPNNPYVLLQNHPRVKEPFQSIRKPTDFNLSYRSSWTLNTVSDSTLQFTLKKLPLVKLWCLMVYQETIQNYLKGLSKSPSFFYYIFKTNFLHILHPQ